MLLQRIPVPGKYIPTEQDSTYCEQMYFHSPSGSVIVAPDGLLVKAGASISFDTCFGAFFTYRWLRYTQLTSIWISLELSGDADIYIERLCGKDEQTTLVIAVKHICGSGTVRINIDELAPEAMYYIRLVAHSDTVISAGSYCCDDDDIAEDVHITAAICTYRREQYVENTLALLDRAFFSNREAPLHGHLSVYIADNASTLDRERLESDSVRIFPNINAGGTGGFTRCILEALDSSEGISHVLLADDDACIMPDAIERLYSFLCLLKPEHRDIAVGGALWRLDKPWEQYESGGCWLGGEMKVFGKGVDLRSAGELLRNSLRNEPLDFNGWWFTCIPIERIRQIGLPLPLFLHRDDIEYGLRLGGRLVIPDGIGVWHETFERRMTGVSEYYDLRNMLIINGVHRPQYSRNEFIAFMRKWYLRNLFSHRYKYIDMNFDGVHDALCGIDHFKAIDAVTLGSSLMAYNYEMSPAPTLAEACAMSDFGEQYAAQYEHRILGDDGGGVKDTLKKALTVLLFGGLILPKRRTPSLALNPAPLWSFFRSGTVLHCDALGQGFIAKRDRKEILRCMERYHEAVRELRSCYSSAMSGYHRRWRELTTEQFWRDYLNINK